MRNCHFQVYFFPAYFVQLFPFAFGSNCRKISA